MYSMEMHEIVDKVENIVKGTLPEATGGQWENHSVSDLVVKYKVKHAVVTEVSKLLHHFQTLKAVVCTKSVFPLECKIVACKRII